VAPLIELPAEVTDRLAASDRVPLFVREIHLEQRTTNTRPPHDPAAA
jgi:hypothetical protein